MIMHPEQEAATPPPSRTAANQIESQAGDTISNACLQGKVSIAELVKAKQPTTPTFDVYDNAWAKEPSDTTTLQELIDVTRSDILAAEVAKVRRLLAEGKADEASEAKRKLPAVSLSGSTQGRRARAVEEGRFQHSGLLQIDLDAKDNPGKSVKEMREALIADPHILAVFITPSGNGVKGIARIPADASTHRACFLAAEAHFASLGFKIDPACKDPVRLCFVSHDPQAWMREGEAEMFEPLPAEVVKERAAPTPTPKAPATSKENLILSDTRAPLDAATVREMLRAIPPRPPYGEWLRIASAVWDAVGEAEGTAALLEWSPEERHGEYADKFKHRLKDVTAGTLAFLAKENGWKGKPPGTRATTDPIPSPDVFRQMLRERAFDVDKVPPPPVPVLLLDGKCIGTPGNIMAPQAGVKAGKSAAVGGIIAGFMLNNATGNHDTLGFTANNPNGFAVLHFDTEQSRFDHDGGVRKALIRAGMEAPPEWFRSFTIADLSCGNRRFAIETAIEDAIADCGGIMAIILDGVADLMRDPNDAEEAFALVDWLHAEAIRQDCLIITVIHENPGSEQGKTRGHLGSQLARKSETNLRLAKDTQTGITTIWADHARHCHIPKDQGVCFAWSDLRGMHVSKGKASEIKASAKREKLREEAEAAFGDADKLAYTDLLKAIMETSGIAEKTAQARIKSYHAEGIIHKHEVGNYSLK